MNNKRLAQGYNAFQSGAVDNTAFAQVNTDSALNYGARYLETWSVLRALILQGPFYVWECEIFPMLVSMTSRLRELQVKCIRFMRYNGVPATDFEIQNQFAELAECKNWLQAASSNPRAPMHKPPSARGSRGEKPARTPLNASPPVLTSSMLTDLSSKQPSAFYSCLAIPVEGAVPIQDADVAPPKILSHAPIESRRAPRKSKTDALAAMQIQAQSTDEQHEMLYDENGVRTYTRSGPPIPVSPHLDLTTVKTISPRSLPPRTKPRPFELEECPTFYPTMEEFKDPMGYIRSISDQAKDSGICKVVPPVGWKMPFVTDTEASVLS